MKRLILLSFVLLLCAACSTDEKMRLALDDDTSSSFSKGGEISSWLYQLQDTIFQELKNSDADLLVIDIEDSGFTKIQVEDLKKEKIVLSYLSVGEAESYRDYWQRSWEPGYPSFIDTENPDWNENYKVIFWSGKWQDIVFSQLDKIIEKGYSGAYFDLVDAYENYEYISSVDTRQEMIDFVVSLSAHARSKDPDFLIFVQNAPELLREKEYLSAIDGIGKEDTWYKDDAVLKKAETEEAIQYLKAASSSGKTVLVIDYPSKNISICNFYDSATAQGFVPYASVRELDLISEIRC